MLKYIMTGAAIGLVLAVVLTTWPKRSDDYSFDGYDTGFFDSDFVQEKSKSYDNAIYGGDIAYKQ